MRLLGLEISWDRTDGLLVRAPVAPISSLYGAGQPISGPNLWNNIFNSTTEPCPGAWQRNIIQDRTSLLSFSAVYSCVTGIASDIAKLRIKLCRDEDGIWTEITEGSPWLPLLRKPNHYQTRLKFVEQWILSKLLSGNTYVGLERDNRGVVNAMYVLDPSRVTPLVADNGDVFYDLKRDNLSQVFDQIVVPASEIIHDSMPGLFHPLVGISPLYASAMSITMGNAIQGNSESFFKNRSLPGGLLTAPGRITDETATRLKTTFEEKFSGTNLGRLFVGGDGLEFKPIAMTAEQADLVEQLKWSVSDVARAFHYPEYKLGGPLPPYSGNIQALTLSYYTDSLQILIESLEAHLDAGLALPLGQGTEMDIDNLLRMDTTSLFDSNNKAVGGGWMAPDEARFRANLPDVEGGDTPYLQQQNFSLAALAKRDAQADPFGKQLSAPQQPIVQPAKEEPLEPRGEYDVEEYAVENLREELVAAND